MKNIKAIGIAFLMFIMTVAVIKITINRGMPEYSTRYGTWVSASKFGCNSGMRELLDNDGIVTVFGSSELRHCQKSGFHGDTIYKSTDMKPVFIGKGGYQSLNHAITLGSLGDKLKNKKVVLSVSPQWFKPNGVKKEAFGASYSETNMIAFLKNKDIRDETKQYVLDRIQTLTDEKPAMWNRVQDDVKWYLKNEGNLFDKMRKGIHSFLAKDKAETKLFLASVSKGFYQCKDDEEKKEIDWKKLYKKADKKGRKKTGNNKYGMLDKVYNRRYKKRIENNDICDLKYSPESIEFQDLQCFLDICKQENIEVLMIMLPLNGRWSDYANYPTERREKIYGRVKAIAERNSIQLADLTHLEYKDYIFEDDSHLALKGLVSFNEQIYNFYKQSKK